MARGAVVAKVPTMAALLLLLLLGPTSGDSDPTSDSNPRYLER